MLCYHDLKQDARVLRAFTSLDPDEFDTLLIAFEKAWRDHVTQHYIQRKSRKRRYGGGRKPHLLAIEDKLLFIPAGSPKFGGKSQFALSSGHE